MLNPPRDEQALREHVFSTYITLRFGMALLAIVFPVLLWALGRFAYGIELRPSMSHYYFAPFPDNATETTFAMRAWFVGFLFAIGTCLYLYKGFTYKENIALNLAGAFAVGVALFPMDIGCRDGCAFTLHGVCAVALFVCLAFVSLRCAGSTLGYLPDEPPGRRAKFRNMYRLLGVLMLASPIVALALTFLLSDNSRYIFFAEAAGVWAFAAYWWVKSREMALSGAEKRALQATLPPPAA